MTPWSYILIPDTQVLAIPSRGLTSYFNGLRDWIAANIDTYNVRWVAGLGDICHNYGVQEEWDIAHTALAPLFDLPIPVTLLAAGNHDSDTISQRARNLTKYNATFPVSLYSAHDWFGGTFEPGRAENMYAKVTIDGQGYLFFMLEFHARRSVLAWVQSVAAAHPTHRVAGVMHSYLDVGGTRNDWGIGNHGPSNYFTYGVNDATSGEEMWAECFSKIPGMFAVHNGHHLNGNVAHRIDEGDAGNDVLQGFYNWQATTDGGRGRVVLMTVDEDAGTIHQRVVRTDLDSFETGTSNGFAYDTVHTLGFEPVTAPPPPPPPPPPPDLPSGYYAVASPGEELRAVDVGGDPQVIYVP